MRNRSLLIITTMLTTGALTLTACGSRDEGKGGEGNGDKTTVVIGVSVPLTGDLSALGQGIKNSVDLAAKTANKNNEVPGVEFKIEPLDDQGQPNSGQQNATKLVANKDVIGVVGPLNSSVAQSMQKIFDNAKLAEVSPANTAPELTQGKDWQTGAKKRQFGSYFRTSTTDAVQGPFAAQYLFNEAKIKKVFVIDDQKTYGAGLAKTFTQEFKKLGGKVVGTDKVEPEERDFNAVVSKVKSSGAEAVYYGGEYPAAGPLSQQLKDSGAKIPLMGGDGMKSDDFIKLNKNSEGDLGTSVGEPVEVLDSAKKFVEDYNASKYADPYETYGGYSYDAGWAVIQAVKAVVQDNGGKLPEDARAKVVEAMSKVNFNGVTGTVAFDEFGDTTNKTITVYKVQQKVWKNVKSGEFTG
ncbi:branched-chain amino acid ABC transporter substrate-binding protein [Streptomyces pathocidini]|uniref:Branched-chain amino acid ABC transporter substrate-binding protein n=1 Tax=Streptomyces pathocidini TaxID=1650571 RepID=A0ABW7UVG8_9ACTN|nr:branched-chain amino acid ABC transporter substrate-binding protein [Streptomyces pathocidini]